MKPWVIGGVIRKMTSCSVDKKRNTIKNRIASLDYLKYNTK